MGETPPDLPVFTAEDRSYWAFQPITDPDTPGVPPEGTSPVDAFLAAARAGVGVAPAPPADRRTLVRRVTFDLTGLPPTPDEVEAFVADDSPDAWERLVERLLASPRYGEHAARFWLDLVRYADSDGFKADKFRPHAWRYRDYVIRSFNADKPYDRFIREQLAGDEFAPDDLDALVATGFLRHTPDEDNQKDVRRQWTTNLQDVTEITGEVFLGLGLRCARCHDHKFDPVLQSDYYRLQAFFAAMLPVNEVLDPSDPERRERWLAATRGVRERLEALEEPRFLKGRAGEAAKFPEYLKPTLVKPASRQSPLERQFTYLAVRQLVGSDKKTREKLAEDEAWQSLAAELATFGSDKPATIELQAMGDVGPVAPPTFVGGDPDQPVEPGVLAILDPGDADVEPVPGRGATTGRRSALADWITDPENPLTARVMVNRLWQWHFGTGIVATANDFGRQGTGPVHPELLDWLASRFMESGWSVKAMHRLILSSRTYRQASGHPEHEAMARLDPANRTLWRHPIRRLSGDQLRDAMLAVSGELDGRTAGPGVTGDEPSRSVFVRQIRNVPDEMLKMFDGPDLFDSCARRYVSTTAVQSLLLMNGPWVRDRAAALAERLKANGLPDDGDRIREAFRLAFGREPIPRELEAVDRFRARRTGGAPSDADSVLADFCHVLLNSNEFAYID